MVRPGQSQSMLDVDTSTGPTGVLVSSEIVGRHIERKEVIK